MTTKQATIPTKIDGFLSRRQDIVLMAPFMIYLALLALRDVEAFGFDYELRWLTSLIRGIGAIAAVLIVRKHLPPWGKPYWSLAIPAGIICAVGWVAGQHFFDHLGIPHRLPLFGSDTGDIVDPRTVIGEYHLYRATVITRVLVAITAVPIVEELFWRAFLLRLFVDLNNFEKVPLGKFTLFSFLGTALLSTIQHPDNWVVSIFCWMAFNLLFYWKKSILFLVIIHGVTNLALYIYVIVAGDWMFW